ncbi:MAG: TIGR02677 family protein [Ktedonobacteraceae bacterium]
MIEQHDTIQNGQGISASVGMDTSLPSSSIFNLTDRLQIFSYLVSSNRVRWYRVIMRLFLHTHRELYRYQLTAHEVRDAVRDTFDPEYTLEQCQNDLAALKEWGNIETLYDSSRATSIASFLAPALLYQATSEAIAIETFLDEQMRASAGKGSLRQGDVARLWASLQRIDEELLVSSLEPSSTDARELAEEWQRAFELWNTMARDAAQYLASMTIATQQGRPDLGAYQVYKAAVVAYVQGFAQALTQYGRLIRELLASWEITERKAVLLDVVQRYLEPPTLTIENMRTPEELLQEAHNQFDALVNWFALGKNADSFRRKALAEVDNVVRLATTLAATVRPNANYATNLDMLAHSLATSRDGEAAQQLFSVAFANLLPIHLPESLAGIPTATQDADMRNGWQEVPSVSVRLRPVNRSFRVDPTAEDPIRDTHVAVRNLIAQQERLLREQNRRFTRLFAPLLLDIGEMPSISIEERAILTLVLDSCLTDPNHQYRAPDGTIILLLNPDEQDYAFLRAPDGVLLLPRYRLQRQSQEEALALNGNTH